MADHVYTPEIEYSKERKSFSYRMRLRRFDHINAIIEKILRQNGNCRILDIGGSEYYWKINSQFIEKNRGKLRITITNIGDPHNKNSGDAMFEHVTADATKPESYAGGFDFIHSNSVIEHVGGWGNIKAMADCIEGSGQPFYVQTPNFWFPMEPHYRTIGFQWLPQHVRARMLLRKPRGFRTAKTFHEAMENVQSVHLLTQADMRELFPSAEIRREMVGPLVKSIMAVKEP